MPSGCCSFASRYCRITGVAGGVIPPARGFPANSRQSLRLRRYEQSEDLARRSLHDAQIEDIAGTDSLAAQHDCTLALADAAIRTAELVEALYQHLDVAADPSSRLACGDLPLESQQVV